MSGEAKINQQLRMERLQRHWSQQELADQLGTTVVSIKRWERNMTIPSPYFRLKLINLFGKSAQELGLQEGKRGVKMIPEPHRSKSTDRSQFVAARCAIWSGYQHGGIMQRKLLVGILGGILIGIVGGIFGGAMLRRCIALLFS